MLATTQTSTVLMMPTRHMTEAYPRGRKLRGQQFGQSPGAVRRQQLVEAADRLVADQDLGNVNMPVIFSS